MKRNYNVDKLDQKIVASLQQSGRQSNTEIAKQLGVSESTIRKRIDRLLKEEIIRVAAIANPLKFEYPIVAIIGIHADPVRISEVARSLNMLPEFRFIGMTTGEFDFVTEAWFHSLEELRVFLTERLMRIKGVNRINTSHVLQMIRFIYDWGRDTEVAQVRQRVNKGQKNRMKQTREK